MMGAAAEKARLPKFSLVLGIESCCEVDDMSCLWMLEIAGDYLSAYNVFNFLSSCTVYMHVLFY